MLAIVQRNDIILFSHSFLGKLQPSAYRVVTSLAQEIKLQACIIIYGSHQYLSGGFLTSVM